MIITSQGCARSISRAHRWLNCLILNIPPQHLSGQLAAVDAVKGHNDTAVTETHAEGGTLIFFHIHTSLYKSQFVFYTGSNLASNPLLLMVSWPACHSYSQLCHHQHSALQHSHKKSIFSSEIHFITQTNMEENVYSNEPGLKAVKWKKGSNGLSTCKNKSYLN